MVMITRLNNLMTLRFIIDYDNEQSEQITSLAILTSNGSEHFLCL